MAQMRRIEFPKIVLTGTKTDDDGQPVTEARMAGGKPILGENGQPLMRFVKEPVKAKNLYLMALSKAGTSTGYEGLRSHLPVSAAVEKADGHVLLDEAQWKLLTSALEAFTQWPWYHDDVLRVIDAAKEAEKVDVEVKEQGGPNRKARRAKKD